LFVAEPQLRPAQVLASGSATHPHALATHEASFVQPPHLIGRSQLSTVSPQRFVQKPESVVHAS
jgi:hypothetical protein